MWIESPIWRDKRGRHMERGEEKKKKTKKRGISLLM